MDESGETRRRPDDGPVADDPGAPRPAAVSFVTTEHFALQGARSATIAESTGRASIFLASVSGGLIALGFMAQASHLGAAFFVFGVVLLPSLAFLGLTTFLRVWQTGVEDAEYAHRIAILRGFYFETAPEVEPWLLSVTPDLRLEVQGVHRTRIQKYLTMAGAIAVLTSILVGGTVGLIAALASNRSSWVSFPFGIGCALVALGLHVRYLHKQMEKARRRLAEPA